VKQVAIITGGTRGIGLGIAQSLAGHGIHLVLNGMRSEADITSVLGELTSLGVVVKYVQGNVADGQVRQALIDTSIQEFGHLNFLINNAGVAPLERNDILDMTERSYDRVMNINLKSAVFLSQLAAKAMIKSKAQFPKIDTSIINMSSVSATMISINRGEYCMSKAGMSMMTQLFATRLGKEGIPVYEVRPGVIKTDMTSGVKEKYDNLIAEGLFVTPRWGYAEDVGKAVLALVKGDFAYSTGQVVMVDGGLSLGRL